MNLSPERHIEFYATELQKMLNAQNGTMPAAQKYLWLLEGNVLITYYKNAAIESLCATLDNGDITLL